MKIILCEFEKKGHCKVYFNSLLKIKGTHLKLIETDLFKKDRNVLLKLIDRLNLLKKFLDDGSEKKIIHILFGDTFFYIPIIRKLFSKEKKIIMTLHNVNKSKIKRFLVKNFSKKVSKVVVHSEFLYQELNEIGVKNCEVVFYPSFFDYSNCNLKEIKQRKKLDNQLIVISLLGGTRKDKGYEILFEAFKYLGKEYKKNIIFNFTGMESYYKNDFIITKCQENNINYICDIREITDEEFLENVFITDIMLMPYLKSFGGNSGPMTEAIVNKIPCITPKELNIGKINLKNNLGEVFECENPKSLAKAIERTIENLGKGIYYNTDFYKELTEEKFLEEYRKIYEKVWSDLENE